MRSLTISKKSLLLRFFLWAWEADQTKLTICKLFWGTIFLPVAFLNSETFHGFLLRLALFYMVGAPLFAITGLRVTAIIWLVYGILFAACGYIFMRRYPKTAERHKEHKEKERLLSALSCRSSAVVDWILEHTFGTMFFGIVFNSFANAMDSRTSRHIGSFFSVIGAYVRAAKQRFCPLIQIV